MSKLGSLTKYFRGGSAEDEKKIRGEIFVPPNNLSSLISFDFHSNVILLGNKGVGKSIFVNVLHEAYLQNNELSILITPDELECDPILSKKTLADQKSVAYSQILRSVAGIIGKHSNENEIAISSEVTELQRMAIEDGYTKPDLISRFAKILAKVTPIGGEIARAILEEKSLNITKNNLTEIVESYLAERGETLWLFIDDIDVAVAKDSKGVFDYSACWAIVSAAIELSQDINDLKTVISVRSDIWHLMTRVQGHGTERKDKLGQIHELKYSEDELQSIFNKRVSLANKDAGSSRGILTFFQDGNILLPGEKGEKRYWNQWIAKISRNRPRDLVKAVQMLIESAKKSGAALIGDAHAHSILEKYGSERIDNIVDEYGQICPQIREVINDLTNKNKYSFLELIEILKTAPNKRKITIDGIPMKSTNEHAIVLLRLLHMASFINPRLDQDEEYKHFNFNEHPDIVDLAKFNELQKYSWQVHPTFHSYSAAMKNRNIFS